MEELTSENKFAIMPEWVIELNISHTAFRLYAILARYADNVTHQAFPARDTLAARLGCSAKTIDRAVEDLVKNGAIKKHSRGRYHSAIYTVMTSAPEGTKMSTDETKMSSDETNLSSRSDKNVHLTRTTELEPLERELLNSFELQFAEWWKVYPNKKGKGAAKVAYRKALKKLSHEELVDFANAYASDPNRVDKYTPYPQKWLNEERWDDEVSVPLSSSERLRAEALAEMERENNE